MVWQRAGTVAVQTGSTTVIGTNLDFAASCRSGDSFIGPDGLNYEVANIAGAAVMSILPAYKGPTVSGAAYAIMPVQGYDKMLSDAFNALNNQFGPKLAALGTTGNYDILPVSKGGTGNATGTAQKLVAGAMVGTVSQSSGLPSGAIFERGSNANGEYTKFADGTMICHSPTISISLSAASGSATWTFPGAFAFVPNCYINIVDASAVNEFSGNNRARNITTQSALLSINSSVQQVYYVRASAFGRWF